MKPIPFVVTLLLIAGLLTALPGTDPDPVRVTLRLIETPAQQEVPGLLSIRRADGTLVHPPELLSRGMGLKLRQLGEVDSRIHDWSVLPHSMEVTLPREKLTISAFSGLETETAHVELDLTGETPADVELKLYRFMDCKAAGWNSANTHLHLMKLSREEADRYLVEIPKADRLDMLFVSYLERTGADHDYISNQLTRENLSDLTVRSGVIFGNGEEHRHNLDGYGEGYGHVMLLNIAKLIQPVSIGPGIMKTGTDGIPLQRGIDAARRDDDTIVWCHNGMGLETLANVVTGRLDAQNIFDGGNRGSYAESFYQYWNAGFPVPISTGTDWFMYDLSRVYVHSEGELSLQKWLESLKQGKTFITNGPLLEFQIRRADVPDEKIGIGEVLNLIEPTRLICEGTARSRSDFQKLELLRNGEVLASAPSHPAEEHFEATINFDFQLSEPSWLALRTPPPPTEVSKENPPAVNEFQRPLFSHTSPIQIQFQGKPYFNLETAEALYKKMESQQQVIATSANFADAQERASVLEVHEAALQTFREYIRNHP